MTSLPSIERLSPEQLAALKSRIEARQAKQAAAAADLKQLLSVAAQNMQAITAVAQAAGFEMPATTQAQAAAPNGGKHATTGSLGKEQSVKRIKRAKRRRHRPVTPVVEAKPAATPHPTKGIKIGIKYRHPENPAQQWSGRGKMPGWMRKTGLPREHFLVK